MDLVALTDQTSVVGTVRHYLDNALADSTRRAYRTDLDHYRAWGGSVPDSADTIATYLTAHADKLAVATLQRRLVAVAKAHTMQGHPDVTKSDLVRLTMRGIRRVHGCPQKQATPIMRDDLLMMVVNPEPTLIEARNIALLSVGFCAALRRSELVGILVENLEFNSRGLVLTIPRSKTDQTGQGQKIAIPHARGRFCPVASVASWLKLSGIESGPIFRSITKGGLISAAALSDRSAAEIIKQQASKAGLKGGFSGHSLRAGLATSAAQAGVSSWKIRAQTRHKSDAMLARYIRDGDIFTDNAAALF